MLGYIAIVNVNFLKNLIFSFQARRGLQRQNCSWQNSTQANTARSLTPCSVSHFWIFEKFNCRLCAVLANFGFSEIFLSCEISTYGS